MKNTISVLVEKDTGGLFRIISLLTRRRFHIESITMAACERKYYERITIILIEKNDGMDADQLPKQIRKLLNVVNVEDITHFPLVERELILIKLQVSLIERAEIASLAEIFKFNITNISDHTIILEITADQKKITDLEKILQKYQILELSRTGNIAMLR